jgi:hypothetical protein
METRRRTRHIGHLPSEQVLDGSSPGRSYDGIEHPAKPTALRVILEQHGIPGAVYTDRASWAVYAPTSGTAPDRAKVTQVGRALARLGIEHIVSFSPQARAE